MTTAEGSRATAASSQTELRLVTVARASLEELLLDYEDFLRQRSLHLWSKDDREAKEVRTVAKSDHADYSTWLKHQDPAVVANAIICLIHQANYLLDQQMAGLERQFVEQGGYSEQLAAARIEKRKEILADQADTTEKDKPICPLCKKMMVLRTAKKGSRSGSQFWGCSAYPKCSGSLKFD